jgi:hypothetical protein
MIETLFLMKLLCPMDHIVITKLYPQIASPFKQYSKMEAFIMKFLIVKNENTVIAYM